MDVAATINRVKAEFKEYLRAERPDWAENTVATYVADAFYASKNGVFPSFWKAFENDETLDAVSSRAITFTNRNAASIGIFAPFAGSNAALGRSRNPFR